MAKEDKKTNISITVANGRQTKLIKGLPFEHLAKTVLPKKYDLSIVWANSKLAKSLNKKYRGKSYVPNVLSFPISKMNGEIFLNSEQIKKDAKKFELNFSECAIYMLIHGMLHLKGYEHGARMDGEEMRLLRKFKIPLPFQLTKTNGKKKHSGRR